MYLNGQFVKRASEMHLWGGVPDSPTINADTMKAAHRLVNVVDARTNTIRPL